MYRSSPVTSWHNTELFPTVSPSAFIHETAILIGNVIVEDDVIIHPGAIIRADEGSPIIIGSGTNVQDGVIMHCLKNTSIVIGSNCSIAHGAVIHGPCRVGDNCFIGFNAVLLKAELGSGSFVSHCALVTEVNVGENKYIPPSSVIDSPDKTAILDSTNGAHFHFSQEVLNVNEELRRGYKNLEESEQTSGINLLQNSGLLATYGKKISTE
ncbi:carbonic anhydrase [Desulfocucumis palustris]|uniref:Carbonic anhydrase n=1 Tax=Desulfocucumis palustris TaxID=1898651 RepID=A0A2L2XBH4_9FIRM|nr:transferase [Desulfocucumis palustris]GBF33033.1 carbonic anhydrase [Desulfocucumis palustris]